jgi:hypothetical protein
MVILNAEAHRVQEQKYSILLAVSFVAVLILYRLSQRFLIRTYMETKVQPVIVDIESLKC